MKRLSESVWSNIQSRSVGDELRKEDITDEFIDSLNRKLIEFSMLIIYHIGEKYEPTLDDFCKYMENSDNGKKIIQYVRRNKDKYEKDLEKIFNFEKKQLEKNVLPYIERFIDDIVYCEKYKNTLPDLKKFADDKFRYNNSKQTFYLNDKYVSVKISQLLDYYIEDNWDSGYLKNKIDLLIKEENDNISKSGFKKEPGKTIADIVDSWWDSLDDGTRDDIGWDEFGEDAEEDYYSDHNPKYCEYEGEDFDADEYWDNAFWRRKLKVYCEINSKNNESK